MSGDIKQYRYMCQTKGHYFKLSELAALDIDRLKERPEFVAKLEKFLDEEGIRRVSFLKSGREAIVFDVNDDMVVRLSFRDEPWERANVPEVLQSIKEVTIDGLKIEILPRADAIEEKDKDSKETEKVMEELPRYIKLRGYEYFDNCYFNYGKLKGALTLVIDAGCAVEKFEKDRDEGLLSKITNALSLVISNISNPCVNWYGAWKQHELCPNILTGELIGVVSREQLEAKQELMGSGTDNVYTRAIEEDGLYPAQFGELVKKAAEEFDPKIGGFAYFIEQQRVAAAKAREI